MVLQAILDAQGDSQVFVEDHRIAETTHIALQDVRHWLETLAGNRYIDVARITAGLSASIRAEGRLALGQFRPFPTPPIIPVTGAVGGSEARFMDRDQVLDVLHKLSTSQFARLISKLPGAAQNLGTNKPVAEQVAELVEWAESPFGPGLERVRKILADFR